MIYEPVPEKRCTKCSEIKPLHQFHRRPGSTDGRNSWCKVCAYKISNGARVRRAIEATQSKPQYQPGHCLKCGGYFPATTEFFGKTSIGNLRRICKACYRPMRQASKQRNRQHIRESAKKEREEKPGQVRARQKRYRDKYRERVHTIARTSAHLHPERLALNALRRRTRLAELPFDWTLTDWEYCLSYWHGCCAVCGRPQGLWHRIVRDHWIPITDQRPDNPGTVPWNILPLCHSKRDGEQGCNNTKNSIDPIEWLDAKLGHRKAKELIKHIRTYFDIVRR